MHGLGNDFVIFDLRESDIKLSEDQIRSICNRNTGVGCDQLIVLKNASGVDCEMVIYNPDASQAEACGNATRCVAMLLGRERSTIKVKNKILSAEYRDQNNISVNMGKAEFSWDKIPLSQEIDPMDIWLSGVRGYAVNVGNPHMVIFVNDTDKYNVADLGPKFEKEKLFPNRANINFAQVVDNENIKLRIWERGTGETIACGSGACATFAVANKIRKSADKVNIHLRGGVLKIEAGSDGDIIMTGPATKVFEGEVAL
jgi:diaminopimelate epimerase